MATFEGGAEAAPPVHTAASVAYGNGEIVIAATATSPEHRIPDDEILFIARRNEPGSSLEVFCLCWLREQTAAASDRASDGNQQEQSSSPAPPSAQFAFFTAALDESAVKNLPDEVLERHLLSENGPVHQNDRHASRSSPALHVIVSTGSGLGQSQVFYDSVLQPLLSVLGFSAITEPGDKIPEGRTPYRLLVTKNARSINEFAQSLGKPSTTSADAPATIVLLSGDGGVVDLLNGMAEQGQETDTDKLPAVALLPLGTGNALFHSLHRRDYLAAAAAGTTCPSSLVLGLRTLFKGCATPLPNFEAYFSPGSHPVSYSLQEEEGKQPTLKEQAENVNSLRGAIVASYGFHAQLVWESDTPEYRKHGDKRFGMAAQELLKTSHAYHADVKFLRAGVAAAKPHHLGQRFNYVLASMVSNLEKTFTISPASEPLDGQLRLVHFGDVGGTKTMEIMMAAYNNGAHVDMRWTSAAGDAAAEVQAEESVGYEAIDELQVDVLEQDARWRKVCIDGTIVDIPQGGWMKVRKAPKPVLQIIVQQG
ncbi:hypothetical protein SEPCBS119000_002821 [Sporothrix epigloea]|uniref:DAGKc domain-containing protein n=1 Tax=Sporothrix epigloea TaxID=1892477 RepID=A0ABP0DJY0_9PEZI